MISKAETLQDKLTKFHSSFRHPIDESLVKRFKKLAGIKKSKK